VNGYGLLYEWTGSDPGLAPLVLLAHQDVVPIEPGTDGRWTEPPFEGRIAAGYVWGRGALDDKGSLVGLLEAVEHLVAAGTKARRAAVGRRAAAAAPVRAGRGRRARGWRGRGSVVGPWLGVWVRAGLVGASGWLAGGTLAGLVQTAPRLVVMLTRLVCAG